MAAVLPLAWGLDALPASADTGAPVHSAGAFRQVSSSDRSLTVEYSWDSPTIRVGEFQVLHLHVVKAPTACTRSAMSLLVDGSMPEHGHGLNYHVVVKAAVAPAEFEARGIMFHMQGGWEIHVDVRCGSAGTRVFIPVAVQAEVSFSAPEIATLARHQLSADQPQDPSNAWLGNPVAIELGQQLFGDARLSSHGQFSCASCHVPEHAWTNGKPMSTSATTIRKVPSLHNVAFSRWFAWDGHADTVWMQILGVMANPREFDTDPEQVTQVIERDGKLRSQFAQVFGSASLPESGGKMDIADAERVQVAVAKTIAAYISTLRTPKTPFDRFVEQLRQGGRVADPALGEAAQRGGKLFIGKARCELCHAGPFFTDGEFHNTGLAYSASPSGSDVQSGRLGGVRVLLASRYNLLGAFSDAHDSTAADKTRYMVGAVAKWGAFKTPGLRNVAKTAPYMHDGRFGTLRDVVRHYQEFAGRLSRDSSVDPLMRPITLSDSEVADLVAFLDSLSSD